MPDSDFVLFRNIPLPDAATGGLTSTVGEPSLFNNGRQIFVTGNWYATRSLDNGNTWSFISPFNFLPPVNGGFCCDQTAIYDPSHDLGIWLLQYIEQGGTNTLRVAIKRGATLGNSNWYWWDFSPQQVNSSWSGEWFDYNHAALSNKYLYVTTNAFRGSDGLFTRCVVMRFPLANLAAGGNLSYSYFFSTTNFSLRCTQGARSVMYFASHNTNSQIRLFSWPETGNTISQVNINVTAWSAGTYSAPGPDGRNWLGRCDPRITGGWVANGTIGFMWTVNRLGARPFPHVRVVRINEASKARIDEPDIWSTNLAYAYADVSPNDRGHLGITLFRGGGSLYPGHVVGIWDDYSNNWSLQATRNGTSGPADGKWGDYLTCRRHSPDGLTWMATGFTLQGGSSLNEIESLLVHFGRRREQGAVSRWQNS